MTNACVSLLIFQYLCSCQPDFGPSTPVLLSNFSKTQSFVYSAINQRRPCLKQPHASSLGLSLLRALVCFPLKDSSEPFSDKKTCLPKPPKRPTPLAISCSVASRASLGGPQRYVFVFLALWKDGHQQTRGVFLSISLWTRVAGWLARARRGTLAVPSLSFCSRALRLTYVCCFLLL